MEGIRDLASESLRLVNEDLERKLERTTNRSKAALAFVLASLQDLKSLPPEAAHKRLDAVIAEVKKHQNTIQPNERVNNGRT